MKRLFFLLSISIVIIGEAHSIYASDVVEIVTEDNDECGEEEITVTRGATWVNVEWKLHCSISDPDDVRNYDLSLIDNTSPGWYNATLKPDCRKNDCDFNVTLAHPCVNYTVMLKVVLFNGTKLSYKSSETETLEEYPSKVRHLNVDNTTKNSASISWNPPRVGQFCVHHYLVCHRFIDSMKAVEKCENVTVEDDDGSLTINDLTPCHSYYITVVAVTKKGKLGSKEAVIGDTLDDAPGDPQNIRIKEAAHDFIAFYWNVPDYNFDCINGIKEVCKINTSKSRRELDGETAGHPITDITEESHNERMGSKYSEVSNLVECTFYDCWVEFLHSQNGTVISDKITSYTNVIGVTISKPTGAEVIESDVNFLEVAWAFPEQGSRCVDGYKLSWESNERVNHTQVGNEVLEYKIDNLVPCTTYNISIAGYSSEWGHSKDGQEEKISHKTSIIAPGEVLNLRVVENSITETEMTIAWDYPSENPQCVATWNVHLSHGVLDEDCDPDTKDGAVFDNKQSVNHRISCLLCDNDYTFSVEAVSENGQMSDSVSVTAKTADCSFN